MKASPNCHGKKICSYHLEYGGKKSRTSYLYEVEMRLHVLLGDSAIKTTEIYTSIMKNYLQDYIKPLYL